VSAPGELRIKLGRFQSAFARVSPKATDVRPSQQRENSVGHSPGPGGQGPEALYCQRRMRRVLRVATGHDSVIVGSGLTIVGEALPIALASALRERHLLVVVVPSPSMLHSSTSSAEVPDALRQDQYHVA
jgi:hypothetical protein